MDNFIDNTEEFLEQERKSLEMIRDGVLCDVQNISDLRKLSWAINSIGDKVLDDVEETMSADDITQKEYAHLKAHKLIVACGIGQLLYWLGEKALDWEDNDTQPK